MIISPLTITFRNRSSEDKNSLLIPKALHLQPNMATATLLAHLTRRSHDPDMVSQLSHQTLNTTSKPFLVVPSGIVTLKDESKSIVEVVYSVPKRYAKGNTSIYRQLRASDTELLMRSKAFSSVDVGN